MKITMEIDLKNKELCEKIFKSLEPDIKKEKEKIRLAETKIVYEIDSENFSHILAASNSILKLINEALKLENLRQEKNSKK